MRLPLLIGGAIASVIALAFGSKKAKASPAMLPESTDSPDDTTYQKTGDQWLETAKQHTADLATSAPIESTGIDNVPGVSPIQVPTDTTVPVAPSGSTKLSNIPNLQTSAGWPAVIPNAGTTSGATSVSSSGAVDDAFDELLANAIAKGDIGLLKDLAKQAELRGLLDVAQSIRAEIARIEGSTPIPTATVAPTVPVTAPTSTYLGRATISMKAGSRGPDVIEWQRLAKVKEDGIFGPDTDRATREFQRTHKDATGKALVVDGIVGPKTWAAAYAVKPTLATEPRPTAVVTTSASRPTISMALNSKGPAVTEWQGIVTVKQDAIFGPITDRATRDWQSKHKDNDGNPLKVDGIVGPKTWAAAYAVQPALSVTPVSATVSTVQQAATAPAESDMRMAAVELTNYLKSIGGIAGRGKEDKTKIKGYQGRLLLTTDGMYGRASAKAVMVQGIIPVTPYYWPSTGTQAAKAEFIALVDQYAAADPSRKSEWDKLRADVIRA